MRRFYFEYDEIGKEWCVFEADEGYALYGVLMFCTPSEQDAIDAIQLLIELQEKKEGE